MERRNAAKRGLEPPPRGPFERSCSATIAAPTIVEEVEEDVDGEEGEEGVEAAEGSDGGDDGGDAVDGDVEE